MRRNLDYRFQIEDINMYDRCFEPDFSFRGESHEVLEMVFVKSGSVEITENENIYLLSSGDVIIHAPMEFHKIRSAENTSPHVITPSFKIKGTFPKELYEGVFSLSPKECDEFIKICATVNDFVNGGTDDYISQEIGCALGLFLIRLLKNHSAKHKFSHTQSAHNYQQIAESMHSEVCANLSLDDFSEMHHLSVSYIQSLFKRYTGASAKHYYLNLRAVEAANLLSDGYTVREISERMNFSSPNYFTTFFKKQTGLTPLQYKLKRTAH